MKRIARIVAPVIAAVALTAALSASAFAASPKADVPAKGGVSTTIPVPAN
jgi:peptidoglycan/LPS O-acetylase OafA/YrhL